ncbi:MAG: DegT/DnrJ/EryC1/StrS family aminotransferase [Hyphomicrobiales bacterium]|nr:DegT/DnrJ/EryC1/StrS family aminotransferase [Hyphomicrobiales bacterium]
MVIAPERIAVAGPSITEREVELVAEATRHGWYSRHYEYNRRFEEMMAGYIGVAHAIAVPHATSALHLILASLGVGPGDEVIVPDVTWIASVAPITYVGAEPVLVDILPDTWCLDPAAVAAAIGPRTKAILAVDLYGSMCDWPALQQLADRHGLHLIEDAAEALGSRLNGKAAGSLGIAAAFSFHGSKTVVTGEGGMLVTNDTGLYQRALVLCDHGRPVGDTSFLNHEIAFKYRMNGITAALGVAQMERVEELVAHKRRILGWYRERLAGHNAITLNAEPEGVINSAWMSTVVIDPALKFDKFHLIGELSRRNIDTRPFFSPLSSLPAFADRAAARRFVTDRDKGVAIARYGINLPSAQNMTEDKADIVSRALMEVLATANN